MRKAAIIFFCLGIVAVVHASTIQSKLIKARGMLDKKDYNAARQLFENVLYEEPNNFDAVLGLAQTYQEMRHYDKAIPHYTNAIALKPTSPKLREVYNNLGVCYNNVGDIEHAIITLEAGVKKYPTFGKMYYNLGNAYFKVKNWTEALDNYTTALTYTTIPDDQAYIYNSIGNTYSMQRDAEAGINAYQNAVKLKPDYWKAYFNLGLTYSYREQYYDAASVYRKVTEIKPDYPDAYYNLGRALSILKKWDEMIVAYEKAIALRPTYYEAMYNLACYYAVIPNDNGQPQYTRALEWLQKAIRQEPDVKTYAQEEDYFLKLRADAQAGPKFEALIHQ